MNTTAVKNSGTSIFVLAADAVVNDDIVALKILLSTDDELIRAGSWREHGAMLLHYECDPTINVEFEITFARGIGRFSAYLGCTARSNT